MESDAQASATGQDQAAEKPRRRHWAVEHLAPEQREIIDRWLADHHGHFLTELRDELAKLGIAIGTSALYGYKARWEQRRRLERAERVALERAAAIGRYAAGRGRE